MIPTGCPERKPALPRGPVTAGRPQPAHANGDLAALRKLGFSDLAILDAINHSAFFANTNRLMLTLGDPFPTEKQAFCTTMRATGNALRGRTLKSSVSGASPELWPLLARLKGETQGPAVRTTGVCTESVRTVGPPCLTWDSR
jgi:hypothetical protein